MCLLTENVNTEGWIFSGNRTKLQRRIVSTAIREPLLPHKGLLESRSSAVPIQRIVVVHGRKR